jgi:ElaB/YqjD/DUF883 family membrane-anchored ribosome-binding protein
MAAHGAKSTVTPLDADLGTDADSANDEVEVTVEASESAAEEVAELEQRLRDTADSIKDSARALGDLASKQIQLHPLASFGIAFLAGLTAAKLLRR